MTDQGGYDLTPEPPKPAGPKPGDPDWVPPTPVIEKASPVEEEPPPPPDPDVEKHKGVAVVGYFCFLIPLIAAPNSPFARYHANQSLLVFIVWVAAVLMAVVLNVGWRFLGPMVDSIGILWFLFGCLVHLLPVAIIATALALTVMGIIHAANGEKKPLPLLGMFSLIK